jgi:hypothetical protein
MTQAQQRMMPEHPRAGIAHYDFDLLASHALIAVHRTICAGWFLATEPASAQP